MESEVESTAKQDNKTTSGGGLDYGITLWHLRVLTDNPWEGGGGYDIRDVADWTPDQVYLRLCDRKLLEGKGTGKGKSVKPAQVQTANDGTVQGRTADGKKIRAKIHGKSLARRLREGDPEAIALAARKEAREKELYGDHP